MNDSQVNHFEDFLVWKESMNLSIDIYKIFKCSKDFFLKNQILKASISIPSNISEGFERNTNKEFIQYLYIAKGSCAEVRTQVYFSYSIGFIDKKTFLDLLDRCKQIFSMLNGLIKTRKESFQ